MGDGAGAAVGAGAAGVGVGVGVGTASALTSGLLLVGRSASAQRSASDPVSAWVRVGEGGEASAKAWARALAQALSRCRLQ